MIFNSSEFNKNWPTKTLADLGTFKRGKSKHRPRNDIRLFSDGKIPLIQTGDVRHANLYINEHSSSYNKFGLVQSKLWPKGTLCITIAANIAETAILSYDMCFPDSIVGFNAYEKECSEHFMHYIFSYIRSSIQSRIQGSIQDNINIEYLTGLNFKIPEKFLRRGITKVLSDLDTKIEVNNKINQQLEAMAKLVYDYWFVQFDFPMSKDYANAIGKPELTGKPYKTSGGKMVYNAELKREIPEGWEDGILSDIAEITMGQSPAGSSYNQKGIGTLFYQGSTDFGLRFPTVRQYTTEPSRMAQKGDVLLSVRAPVGTINQAMEDCCIGRGLASLREKKGSISYLWSQMVYFKQIFDRKNASGTTFGAITKNELFG